MSKIGGGGGGRWAVVVVVGGSCYKKTTIYLYAKNLAARFITILAPSGAVYYNFGAFGAFF